MPIASDRGSRPSRSSAARLPRAARRMLIHGIPWSIPLAKIGTIAGWSSRAMTLASCSNRAAKESSCRNSGGSTLRATARSSRGSCASYTAAIPPLPSRRTIVNGPTVDPGLSVTDSSSAAPAASAKALAKRQAGHNPAGETAAVHGAPHRAQGMDVRGVGGSLPPHGDGGGRFGSERQTHLSRERALDQIAEYVLLHGRVQQIGASERNGHPIGRSNAEACIQHLVRRTPPVIGNVEHVLPERPANIARRHSAKITAANAIQPEVHAMRGRHIQFRRIESGLLRACLP